MEAGRADDDGGPGTKQQGTLKLIVHHRQRPRQGGAKALIGIWIQYLGCVSLRTGTGGAATGRETHYSVAATSARGSIAGNECNGRWFLLRRYENMPQWMLQDIMARRGQSAGALHAWRSCRGAGSGGSGAGKVAHTCANAGRRCRATYLYLGRGLYCATLSHARTMVPTYQRICAWKHGRHCYAGGIEPEVRHRERANFPWRGCLSVCAALCVVLCCVVL